MICFKKRHTAYFRRRVHGGLSLRYDTAYCRVLRELERDNPLRQFLRLDIIFYSRLSAACFLKNITQADKRRRILLGLF